MIRPAQTTLISDLSEFELREMVHASLLCALGHGVLQAATASAFIVTRFVAAPNFPEHPAVRAWLEDSRLTPDERVRQLVQRLTPRDWRDVRRSYRPSAWQS